MPSDDANNALITTVAELTTATGRKLGPTGWRSLSQDEVTRFADLTDDHNFIHVDPVRAKETPFGGTIVHGFLTLSFLGPFTQELIQVRDAATSINYGLNKVRFPSPLRVGAQFRAAGEVIEVTPLPTGVQVAAAFTIEARGESKPVLAAECLLRYYR